MNINKKIVLRVPATSANVGPGFDSLGMALNIYTEVSFELSGSAEHNDPKKHRPNLKAAKKSTQTGKI